MTMRMSVRITMRLSMRVCMQVTMRVKKPCFHGAGENSVLRFIN